MNALKDIGAEAMGIAAVYAMGDIEMREPKI